MSDIVRLFLIIVFLTIGLAAYFLVAHALFSPWIARIRSITQSMPGRSLGIGLVNFVFFAMIAVVQLSVAENTNGLLHAILSIPALVILAVLAIALSLGLAAMTSLIGERLFAELPAWKQMLWGTVCLSLACALPFAGWFLLLPYLGLTGIGGVILGFLKRNE